MSVGEYRRAATTEHSLQVQVLEYLTTKAMPDVYWHAIPNAGQRSFRTASKMKSEGLTAGVADLCIMLPAGRAAWLEMKRPKGGRSSDAQKGFAARCRRLGHPYAVAKTFEEAVAFLGQVGALR
jgi:hypothetical protein